MPGQSVGENRRSLALEELVQGAPGLRSRPRQQVIGEPKDLLLPAAGQELGKGVWVQLDPTGPVGRQLPQLRVEHAQIRRAGPQHSGRHRRRQLEVARPLMTPIRERASLERRQLLHPS